jgi:hypothetical protein
MKLTQMHAAFWLYHRGPQWIPRKLQPSIHQCINEHAERRLPDKAGNTISLLRLMMRNGSTRYQALIKLANSPYETSADHRKYCRRWLAKIKKGSHDSI